MLKPEMVTAPDARLADLAKPRDMEAPGANP